MKDDRKRVWPKEAAAILSTLLGRSISERTLSNWRYARRGPKPEYFNGRVDYQLGELRRFAREAFQPQPPIRYRRQGVSGEQAAAARRQEEQRNVDQREHIRAQRNHHSLIE
jgi:hypothetical protein